MTGMDLLETFQLDFDRPVETAVGKKHSKPTSGFIFLVYLLRNVWPDFKHFGKTSIDFVEKSKVRIQLYD